MLLRCKVESVRDQQKQHEKTMMEHEHSRFNPSRSAISFPIYDFLRRGFHKIVNYAYTIILYFFHPLDLATSELVIALLVFFFKHEYNIFSMNDNEYLVENNKKSLQISQLKKYGTK